MKYFTLVGSYDGGWKVKGQWQRVKNLNYVDKTGWQRHNGPLTPAMKKVLANPIVIDAKELVKLGLFKGR